MYNNLDFTQPGGLWLTQDVLKAMQDGYAPVIDGIAKMFGNKCIVSGVDVAGGTVADGWVVYNGELLPFVGGSQQAFVEVESNTLPEQYEDGTQKDFYYSRRLRMISIATANSFPFTDLVKPALYKNIWLKGDTKAVLCDNAYITANFDLTTGIALATSERAGWKIAFEMGGRVMMGWSNIASGGPADNVWDAAYNNMQAIGGEKLHQLLISEIPAHNHNITASTRTNFDGAGKVPGVNASGNESGGATENAGGGQAHENRMPFKVYLFIEKI